jgi:hypothetical protein
VADRCECHLPTDPPDDGTEWWQPTIDDEPRAKVQAVARFGEPPDLRRAVRRPDGTGWCEYGAMVNYYQDITPPMPWNRVGMCWNEVSHPVVVCEPQARATSSRPARPIC